MRVALSFLTRIPLGRINEPDYLAALGRQAPLFPLVGVVVGLVVCLADAAAGLFFSSGSVRSVVAVAAGLWVTGALHLDGLMDTADGVLSHRSRERMLDIMQDSRVGAMGVMAAVVTLLLKVALLLELGASLSRWPALLLAPALGRMAMAAAAGLFPPARREGGLGAGFAAHVGRYRAALAAGIGLALALICGLATGGLTRPVAAWAIASATAWFAGNRLTAHLGGLTGDTYGAINELAELAVLAVMAAGWLSPGGIPW